MESIESENKKMYYALNEWMPENKSSGVVWGTTGHRQVGDLDSMKVSAMMFVNYAKNRNITVSLGGANGWDTLVLLQCVEKEVKYILRLPFEQDFVRLYEYAENPLCVTHSWFKEKYCGRQDIGVYFARNKQIIQDAVACSNKAPVIGAHWDGRTTGGTYNTIKVAVDLHCVVFNFYNMQWYNIANFIGHL